MRLCGHMCLKHVNNDNRVRTTIAFQKPLKKGQTYSNYDGTSSFNLFLALLPYKTYNKQFNKGKPRSNCDCLSKAVLKRKTTVEL